MTGWGYAPNGTNLFDWTNGKDASQFLILGIVLAVVWFLLTVMFSYYFYAFKKQQAEDKIYGPKLLWTTLGIGLVIMVDWILVLVFYLQASNVFGENNGDTAYGILVMLVVVGFVLLLSVIVMMWFFLPYYGIAFDDKRILFMGESIPYASITKIVIDEKSRATYINYRQGKRTHKRLKFPATSGFGQFIQTNASVTGKDLSEEDEKAYYQSLMTSDKVAEKKLNEDIAKKQQQKSIEKKDNKNNK